MSAKTDKMARERRFPAVKTRRLIREAGFVRRAR